MKVFIEQSCEKNRKNIFDKDTKKLLRTVGFHITYPFPYGYILGTLAEDGAELDCYIITDKKLETGAIVECDAIGMVEFFEDGTPDHKIFMSLNGENATVDESVKEKLLAFNENYFINKPEKSTQVGDFLGIEEAIKQIERANA